MKLKLTNATRMQLLSFQAEHRVVELVELYHLKSDKEKCCRLTRYYKSLLVFLQAVGPPMEAVVKT